MPHLPTWAVDNRTAVEREAAPYRAMSVDDRLRLVAAACRAAARQLAARADAARLRDHRDPLPPSSVAALARLTGTPRDEAAVGRIRGGPADCGRVRGPHIPYAIGGALAYGQYGIPRATNDVDVNVFVADDGLPAVCAALRSLGIAADDESVRRDAACEGLSVLRYGDFRLDLFTPSIAFVSEAKRAVGSASKTGTSGSCRRRRWRSSSSSSSGRRIWRTSSASSRSPGAASTWRGCGSGSSR